MEKVREGNQQALRVLIERYKSHLFKVIYGVVRDEQEAEDITQETFIKMMDALPSYQSQGFKTWISRIAFNKAIDAKRKKQRQKEVVGHDEQKDSQTRGSAEHEWLQQEKITSVAKSIEQLPETYQGVVKAYYIHGKSYQEIAKDHHIEEKTVEMRLYRARKWMKKNWKEDEF
ncbi:RNA polymerase sigma factor [Pontibacillus marinus]|uniref:RNA polymerase sigma factor n=1 Tax=Pontibacillus marinus TaxID=273164 RepID=UPI00227729E1|nr:RNA polymerase sigma factor [Pontibacillus marinus]